jgi:hypothetical protein
MPFMSSIAGLSLRAFGFAWGALSSVFDNWVSGTPRSLGTSTSGQAWTVVQGAFTASGSGTATTSTSASSYPFATVGLHQNVQSSIQNAVPGSGLVFWETDAGDWWASIVNATTAQVQTGTTPVDSDCCTGSNTCTQSACCTYQSCPPGCAQTGFGTCYSLSTGYPCNGGGCIASTCCTGSNTCVGGYPCYYTPVYTTYYYWGLSIIKSVASAISTVVNVTINTVTTTVAQIQSLSLTVIGGNVSAQAYSDTALTTPDGSPLATTGTPGGTNVGIMVAPTDVSAATAGTPYNQGNSVGQFSGH